MRRSSPSSLGDTVNCWMISPGPPATAWRTTTWWLATTAASMPTAMALPSVFKRALLSLGRLPESTSQISPAAAVVVRPGEPQGALPPTVSPTPPATAQAPRRPPKLVGHPMLTPRLLARGDRALPSIPSTGSARETGPGDDLFLEPDAQPKCVTAGVPPEATLRIRLLWSVDAPYRYKPATFSQLRSYFILNNQPHPLAEDLAKHH